MGCVDSKVQKENELEFKDINMKIQTVLGAPNSRTKSKTAVSKSNTGRHVHRSSGKVQNNRRPDKRTNRSNSRQRKEGSNNISPRPKSTRCTQKTSCDPKITAKYDIKAVIGKGTFSRVVRVEHRLTKQPYAIKMIEAPEGRDVFEAELSVLRRVNHSNVISLIEVFESNQKIYMVMELATGGNLLDRLETHGCFSENDTIRILKMVLSGLSYLHSLGITHRDMKPDNLLYYHPGSDSKIMITDFGFASTRKAIGNPFMHTVCGTPQYIAPEIVARRPYTCAVDIWAVGVITYILLSGTFPFDAEQDAVLFKLILSGKFNMSGQVWSEVSENAKKFVCSLLQRDFEQRLSAQQALEHKWILESSSNHQLKSNSFSSPSNRYTASQYSSRSSGSVWSGRSFHSLRSGHRRVCVHQLEELHSDPEVAAML